MTTWQYVRDLAKYRLQTRIIVRRYAVQPRRWALFTEAELRALWGDR